VGIILETVTRLIYAVVTPDFEKEKKVLESPLSPGNYNGQILHLACSHVRKRVKQNNLIPTEFI
jgi:hypothetical protein